MVLRNHQFSTVNVGANYVGESWGIAWGDVNGDGLPDLWASHHQEPFGTLYVNQRDGSFIDLTRQYFPTIRRRADFHGAAWADVDNDGDQDLVQLSGGGPGRGDLDDSELTPSFYEYLFINRDNQLIERTDSLFTREYALGRGWNPLWFDVDNDSRLDLFYSGFANPGGRFPATLFRQTKNSFRDIGRKIQIDGFLGADNFATLADFDGDNRLELVVRTRDNAPLKIYRIQGFPFEDSTQEILGKIRFEDKVRDIAIADFNGDLKLDMFVLTRNRQDYLLLNRGGQLVDASQEAGLRARATKGKNVVAGDFDNDGDLDIFIVTSGNSTRDGQLVNTPDILLENRGGGRFKPVQNAGGAPGTNLGIGDSVTTVDYDRDGFLDLYVTNGDLRSTPNGYRNAPYQLFRNQGNSNRWLQVELEGVQSNRDGIGATVILTNQGEKQIRFQDGGMHNRVQNDKQIHFGLGTSRTVQHLQVTWPSGLTQTIRDIRSNKVAILQEGVGASGADQLIGTDQDDVLTGKNGNDEIIGWDGNDRIEGGPGADLLQGGKGQDYFIFNRRSEGRDVIREFSHQEDRIQISKAGFSAKLRRGPLPQSQFVVGSTAQDRNDYFIFNRRSGNLFFDRDGQGGKAPLHLAQLQDSSGNLTAANIEVV